MAHKITKIIDYFSFQEELRNAYPNIDIEKALDRSLILTPKSKDFSQNSPKGYRIHDVESDEDCGYTGFRITRENAFKLLNDRVKDVSASLPPAISQLLTKNEFYDYLIKKKFIEPTISFSVIQTQLESYSKNPEVIAGYIQCGIEDKIPEEIGWAHPVVLQALAHIQRIEIHMWQLGKNHCLVPYSLSGDYDTSNGAKQRLDLLYTHGNHFERLKLEGFDGGNFPIIGDTELIYPLEIQFCDSFIIEDPAPGKHSPPRKGTQTNEKVKCKTNDIHGEQLVMQYFNNNRLRSFLKEIGVSKLLCGVCEAMRKRLFPNIITSGTSNFMFPNTIDISASHICYEPSPHMPPENFMDRPPSVSFSNDDDEKTKDYASDWHNLILKTLQSLYQVVSLKPHEMEQSNLTSANSNDDNEQTTPSSEKHQIINSFFAPLNLKENCSVKRYSGLGVMYQWK